VKRSYPYLSVGTKSESTTRRFSGTDVDVDLLSETEEEGSQFIFHGAEQLASFIHWLPYCTGLKVNRLAEGATVLNFYHC